MFPVFLQPRECCEKIKKAINFSRRLRDTTDTMNHATLVCTLGVLIHSYTHRLLLVEGSTIGIVNLSIHKAFIRGNNGRTVVLGRKPAFFSGGFRNLKNDIEIESIVFLSRGGHSFDLEYDYESEDDHDDDHDTNTDTDDDDEEESSGDEYDWDKATDSEGSQGANNDFFYFLFIDAHLNG